MRLRGLLQMDRVVLTAEAPMQLFSLFALRNTQVRIFNILKY